MPGAGVRQADRDLALDMRAIEPRDHLQLLELVGSPPERAVEIRELFASGNQARRQRDGLFERVDRLGGPPDCPAGRRRAGSARRGDRVELEGLRERRQRGVEVAAAISGEGQLVPHQRRSFVELQPRFVDLGRPVEPLPLILARRRAPRADAWRGSSRGEPEVAGGGVEFVALAVALAAPEVGKHRVRPEGDGAAVGFDRAEGLAVAQRGVAAARAGPVLALTADGLVGQQSADAGEGDEQQRRERSFHAGSILSSGHARNLRHRPGSNRDIVEGVTRNVAAFGDFSLKQARVVGWSDVGGREASLVQRCAAGDESACAELVAEHQRMVVQLAINLLGDRDEALDLSQEVFLRVFRTIHRFRGQSSLRTWIYRIAVNQARNRHRFWRRRHRADQVSLDAHVAAHGDFLPAGDAGPDRVLAQKELAEQLNHALERLPFDQRTAIVLREIDGLSYEEIAYSLGVAIGTVKSRLTRARQALRLELREVRTA